MSELAGRMTDRFRRFLRRAGESYALTLALGHGMLARVGGLLSDARRAARVRRRVALSVLGGAALLSAGFGLLRLSLAWAEWPSGWMTSSWANGPIPIVEPAGFTAAMPNGVTVTLLHIKGYVTGCRSRPIW